MCREQDPESKVEMVWACWAEGRERLGEEMHKDECDRSGEQRCSEENVAELCQADMEAMGIKEEVAQDHCAWRNITSGPTCASADAWHTMCV